MGWAEQLGALDDWAASIDKGVTVNGGTTIVLYNQAKDIRTKTGGSLLSGGFCLAMSIMWVIKTAHGDSFWDWFQPPIQACPNLKNRSQTASVSCMAGMKELMRVEGQKTKLVSLMSPTQLQALTPEMSLDAHAWFAPKIAAESASVREKGAEGHFAGMVTGEKVADLVLRKSGFKVISGYGRKGHAMAARVLDGTVVFMDPNYGEFYFPTYAQFRKFMVAFWRNKYAAKLSDSVLVNAFSDPEMIKYG